MEKRIGKKTNTKPTLVDRFGRIHDYLRFSITDNCNFSCSYCRPNGTKCTSEKSQMPVSEIKTIIEAFAALGIEKVRLTGGEPLAHSRFNEVALAFKEYIIEKAITTNALLLDKYFDTIMSSGFKTINISLDTLKPHKFKQITGSSGFNRVYSNFIKALYLGFQVKLNVVLIKGINDDEVIEFARLTKEYPISIRFIEFMPFANNKWEPDKLIPHDEIIHNINKEIPLVPVESNNPHIPAKYYNVKDSLGQIGVISTVTKPFCADCNRIRITSDGKIKSCLFGHKELDLIQTLNSGKNIKKLILESLMKKPEKHGGLEIRESLVKELEKNREMYAIGG